MSVGFEREADTEYKQRDMDVYCSNFTGGRDVLPQILIFPPILKGCSLRSRIILVCLNLNEGGEQITVYDTSS